MIGHDRLGSVTSWVDHKQKVAAKSPRVPCCLVDAAFFRFPHTPTPSPLWHRTTRSSNSQLDRNREHVLAANFQAWLVPKISVCSAFSAFCFHVLFFLPVISSHPWPITSGVLYGRPVASITGSAWAGQASKHSPVPITLRWYGSTPVFLPNLQARTPLRTLSQTTKLPVSKPVKQTSSELVVVRR